MTYSLIWVVVSAAIFISLHFFADIRWDLTLPIKIVAFAVVTFVAHTITDYFTSRLNSKLWKEKRSHEFFISVGFDQVLHYAQLFATYIWLFK